MKLLFWLVLAAVGSALADDFSYDRCAAKGPAGWSGTCGIGTQGSPVDLCAASTFPGAVPTMNTTNYGLVRRVNFTNPGDTLKLVADEPKPTLNMGPIASIVGRGTSANITWKLEQMHLHWGRTGLVNEGSEHYIQGHAYAGEVHLVHYNPAYGDSVAAAVATGNQDALLVVGILLEQGTYDAPIMQTLAAAVPMATPALQPLFQPVQFSQIFDTQDQYYAYAGSLTTPGCNEQVTWVVLRTPRSITLDTLNRIKEAKTLNPDEPISRFGNFRPLQPINGRTIYSSAGQTAACTTPTPPYYFCSSGDCPHILSVYSYPNGLSGTPDTQRITLADALVPDVIQCSAPSAWLWFFRVPRADWIREVSFPGSPTVKVTSWGNVNTHTMIAVVTVYSLDAAARAMPDPGSFLISRFRIERMTDLGVLANTPNGLNVEVGPTANRASQVLLFNTVGANAVGNAVQGDTGMWAHADNGVIMIRTISGEVFAVYSLPAARMSPKPSEDEGSNDALFGLLALIAIPLLCCCLLGFLLFTMLKKKQAPPCLPMSHPCVPEQLNYAPGCSNSYYPAPYW